MNTKDGYAKKSLTSARLLTADGGDTDNYLPLTGGTMTGALVTTALSVSGAATFSLAINGNILGNAATASRLLNARTISLTGDITGSGSFDGSGNLSIATTKNHTHNYLPLSGGTLTGALTLPSNKYADSTTDENRGALFLSNSNIWGVNSIYTDGLSYNASVGIHFYRDATHVDSIHAKNGNLYFTPNREIGTSGTSIKVSLEGHTHTYAESVEAVPIFERYINYIAGNNITLSGISYTLCSILSHHVHDTDSNKYIIELDLPSPSYGDYIQICTQSTISVSKNGYFKFNDSDTLYEIRYSNIYYHSFWGIGEFHLDMFPIRPNVYYYFRITTEDVMDVAMFSGNKIYKINTAGGSGGSGTPSLVDDIFSGSALQYSPYTSKQSELCFYTGNTDPDGTTRLNLNGYLYGTKLFSGGSEVSPVTIPSSTVTLSTTAKTYITVGTTERKMKLPASCPWSISLSDLSDTTITSATNGDYLRYNGTAWVSSVVNLAASWGESGSGKNGASQPTLSLGYVAFANAYGANISGSNPPGCLYYPENEDYDALPVVMDSLGRLFVAISKSLSLMVKGDSWGYIEETT